MATLLQHDFGLARIGEATPRPRPAPQVQQWKPSKEVRGKAKATTLPKTWAEVVQARPSSEAQSRGAKRAAETPGDAEVSSTLQAASQEAPATPLPTAAPVTPTSATLQVPANFQEMLQHAIMAAVGPLTAQVQQLQAEMTALAADEDMDEKGADSDADM